MLPLRALGWLLSALSILNLIQDVEWVSIAGKLALWLAAYRRVALALNSALFGWLHLLHLKVSYSEFNLLVVVATLSGALARSRSRQLKPVPSFGVAGPARREWVALGRTGQGVLRAWAILAITLGLLVGLDESLSLILSCYLAGGLFLGALFLTPSAGEPVIDPGSFRTELLSIVATIVLLLLANQALKPQG